MTATSRPSTCCPQTNRPSPVHVQVGPLLAPLEGTAVYRFNTTIHMDSASGWAPPLTVAMDPCEGEMYQAANVSAAPTLRNAAAVIVPTNETCETFGLVLCEDLSSMYDTCQENCRGDCVSYSIVDEAINTCTRRYCGDGRWENANMTGCEDCPVGMAGTVSWCDDCLVGTEQNATRTGCDPCEAGFASWGGRGTKCEQCGPATAPDQDQGVCEPCAVGDFSTDGVGCLSCRDSACNRHSSVCDAATAVCSNCTELSAGSQCEVCIAGAFGDATAACLWQEMENIPGTDTIQGNAMDSLEASGVGSCETREAKDRN